MVTMGGSINNYNPCLLGLSKLAMKVKTKHVCLDIF